MKCVYCPIIEGKNKDVDLEKIFTFCLKYQPKHLTITGGEPTLIRGLEDFLKKLRENVNAQIILNSNLTTDIHRIHECLRYVDVLSTSLDGLGNVNTLTRGVDGDDIIARIRSVVDFANQEKLNLDIVSLSVVNKHNYASTLDIANALSDISPKINLFFGGIIPQTHELSIWGDTEKQKVFKDQIEAFQGPNTIKVIGVLQTDTIERTNLSGVQCKRQFFRARVQPNGRVLSCKDCIYPDFYKREINRMIQVDNYKEAVKTWLKAMKLLYFKPNDIFCPEPCNCEEYFEHMLNYEDSDTMPGEADMLAHRFLETELALIDKWLVRHGHKQLNAKIREKLLEK